MRQVRRETGSVLPYFASLFTLLEIFNLLLKRWLDALIEWRRRGGPLRVVVLRDVDDSSSEVVGGGAMAVVAEEEEVEEEGKAAVAKEEEERDSDLVLRINSDSEDAAPVANAAAVAAEATEAAQRSIQSQ